MRNSEFGIDTSSVCSASLASTFPSRGRLMGRMPTKRLPLEGKLSAKLTDEVSRLPQANISHRLEPIFRMAQPYFAMREAHYIAAPKGQYRLKRKRNERKVKSEEVSEIS